MDASSEAPRLHDVIIVGAGPCGLAVAARLREQTPSALFTDSEHERYHWLRKHGRRMSLARGRHGVVDLARPGAPDLAGEAVATSPSRGATGGDGDSRRFDHPRAAPARRYDTLVLDAAADTWLAQWKRLFRLLGIEHLRSPMFFHVDPRDRDGLLAFTHEQRRRDELREITGCVGKEVSKHRQKRRQRERMSKELGKGVKAALEIDERDRKDYYVPSSQLFESHCDCIVSRYGLASGLVRKEAVVDIDFRHVPALSAAAAGDKVFTVTTDAGARHHARTVVLAVGAGGAASVPDCCGEGACEPGGRVGDEGMCHSHAVGAFPHPRLEVMIKSGQKTAILVVGGGLTSAQLADLALKRGVSKVWLIMRSGFKVKPFDVNLEWMGKFKNHEKAVFWSADGDEERLQQIRAARNGGSITPPYAKILRAHKDSGRLSIHTYTNLVPSQCRFDGVRKKWRVATDPVIPGLSGPWPDAKVGEDQSVEVDYIYFATGVAADFATMPCLQTMLRRYPLHGHGGLPCLSEDLMWRGAADGVPLMRRDERSKVDGGARSRRSGGARNDAPAKRDDDGSEDRREVLAASRRRRRREQQEDATARGSAGHRLTRMLSGSQSDDSDDDKEEGAAVEARKDGSEGDDDEHDDDGEEGVCRDPGERVPLFVTGRLASLRLGPGGGNLEGARVGAERVAWALQEVVDAAKARAAAVVASDGARGGREDDVASGLEPLSSSSSSSLWQADAGEGDANAKQEGEAGGGSSGRRAREAGARRQDEARYRYAVGLGSRFESLSVDG